MELLGLQEAVELLAGVAEINASQIPPVCLEIAQLWYIHNYSLTIAMTTLYLSSGRLPLCLNIVGKLVKNYGPNWQEDVPDIRKCLNIYSCSRVFEYDVFLSPQ